MILDTIRRKEYDNAKERAKNVFKALFGGIVALALLWVVIVIAFTW